MCEISGCCFLLGRYMGQNQNISEKDTTKQRVLYLFISHLTSWLGQRNFLGFSMTLEIQPVIFSTGRGAFVSGLLPLTRQPLLTLGKNIGSYTSLPFNAHEPSLTNSHINDSLRMISSSWLRNEPNRQITNAPGPIVILAHLR